MPAYDTFPPAGFDRASGTALDNYGFPIGTPTPAGAVQYFMAIPPVFEELPDSPEIERAEQATFVHRFRVDPVLAKALIFGIGRGKYFMDSNGFLYRVLSARLNWQKPDIPVLTITSESISFDTPPDEFRIEVVELNPAIEKHPRYFFLLPQIRNFINNSVTAAQMLSQAEALKIIGNLQGILGSDPNTGAPYDYPNPTGSSLATWANAQKAANELLLKRRIGEDTFYMPGFRLVWSQYFWKPYFMNPGGYIADPIDEGLPAFFWSPYQDSTIGTSIFTLMASINPQLYSEGISWLRQTDTFEWSRTWFKLTHTWIGAPYSHWDADIYSREPSPYPPPPPVPIS